MDFKWNQYIQFYNSQKLMKTTNVDGHGTAGWKNTTGYLDPLRLSKTPEITLNMANLQHGQQSIVFFTSSVGRLVWHHPWWHQERHEQDNAGGWWGGGEGGISRLFLFSHQLVVPSCCALPISTLYSSLPGCTSHPTNTHPQGSLISHLHKLKLEGFVSSGNVVHLFLSYRIVSFIALHW